jgi:protein-L-isoaspartate O-methyltransferase
MTWAAGVSASKWPDAAFAVLHPYAAAYTDATNVTRDSTRAPAIAFKAWNQAAASLEDVEMRIHDGVPREMLRPRATAYVDSLAAHFPHAMPRPGGRVVEIGSGVGYIMEAAQRRFQPRSLVGVDVAPAMVAKARRRLARDGASIPPRFVVYDGVTIPMRSQSVDLIYSVACLQHIPKPYVYNLIGEMLRILKVSGFAAPHLLSFTALRLWEGFDFRRETLQQLLGTEGHWHHFYSADELSSVLENGYFAAQVKIVETRDGSIWVSFRPGGDNRRR